ncbi:MAG: cell division protein ZapA [Bryobacteraceae bacterium]|nr:cell division protein ZapA [Bryobacteraceae bacterium]
MSGADKNPVRLSIFNQTFTVRVSGDPGDIQRAANAVDELMSTIAKSANVDSTRVAILACLHLQDRIYQLEAELTGVRSRVADRSHQLALLLDELVAEDQQQL